MPGHRLPIGHRYVFVAGLHRTGTSLLARMLASHPDIAGIDGAPVPENEGCYLQGAIPHTARHGIPGHYATDPAQHLTEGCALDTLETRSRLEHDWGPWFDSSAPWRLEKSPVNLSRMRLLQALFPLAQFLVISRHPQFMAQALAKWTDAPAADLAAYGAAAYAQALEDLTHLHAAMLVRYEDLVRAPDAHLSAVERFLDLGPGCQSDTLRDGNADYTVDYRAFDDPDGAAARLGYRAGGTVAAFEPIVQHPLRAAREETLSLLG